MARRIGSGVVRDGRKRFGVSDWIGPGTQPLFSLPLP
jgi:hypothetical protein